MKTRFLAACAVTFCHFHAPVFAAPPLQVLAGGFSLLQQQAPTEPVNLLSNGTFLRGDSGWEFNGEGEGATAKTPEVKLPEPARGGVYRASVAPRPGADAWSTALRQTIKKAVKKGQNLIVSLWLRSPQSVPVGIVVEGPAPDYAKSILEVVDTSPQWKQFTVRGQSAQDYDDGQVTLQLQLARGTGDIEIADVQLFDPDAPQQTAQRSTATPQQPQSLLKNSDFSAPDLTAWKGFGALDDANARLKAALVPADTKVVGSAHALQLNSDPAPEMQPWNLKISQPIDQLIGDGDAIYARVWLRSPDNARAGIIFEQAAAPNTKDINSQVQLTPQWKEFRFAGIAHRAFAPGESQFNVFVGYGKGTIEIANLRLENYGAAPLESFDQTIDYFGGKTDDDSWRAPALARIEKIRKGDFTVRVLDAKGQPVSGAKVSIEQQKHWFKWGTAVPASQLLDNQSPNSEQYREHLKQLFNTVVFESDLKWPQSQKPEDLERITRAVDWLHQNGINNIRGHNIVWGSDKFLPQGMMDLPADELKRRVEERARSIVEFGRGKVYVWDVVNEAATNTALWEKIGWDEFGKVYKIARAYDPNVKLAYNDYNVLNEAPDNGKHQAKVYERIKTLQEQGAPLDIIGLQSHFGVPLTPMKRVLEILDETAQFGPKIEITEFDVGVKDDKMNAKYTRDFLIATFSHPAVSGFLMWGFWEGAHWRAAEGGAIFNRDWTPRLAATAYEDLLFKQWWTKLNGQSNKTGTFSNRAFYGTHLITVEKNGQRATQTVELVPDGAKNFTLKLP